MVRKMNLTMNKLVIKSSFVKLVNNSCYGVRMYFCFLFLLLSACSDQNLPKYNVLDRLRILALEANKPEESPGQSIQITPIVSDITESTALSYAAYGCLDQGIALGAEPTCVGSITKIALGSGVISTLGVARAFTGEANIVSLTLPSAQDILALRSPAQQYNGVAYIFEYILKNSRGEQVSAIKRIAVSDTAKTSKNINPIINDFLLNGAIPASLPLSQTSEVSISFTGSPTESYQKMLASGELVSMQEEAMTTWFVTDGKMKYQRTIGAETNEYEGPSERPSSRPAFLIAITRDGRGGVHHKIKCFGTCP